MFNLDMIANELIDDGDNFICPETGSAVFGAEHFIKYGFFFVCKQRFIQSYTLMKGDNRIFVTVKNQNRCNRAIGIQI